MAFHNRAKQTWEPGATVKVGFLAFTIIGKIPTPGDYRPDAWLLNGANDRPYPFTPHCGLERLDRDEGLAYLAQLTERRAA